MRYRRSRRRSRPTTPRTPARRLRRNAVASAERAEASAAQARRGRLGDRPRARLDPGRSRSRSRPRRSPPPGPGSARPGRRSRPRGRVSPAPPSGRRRGATDRRSPRSANRAYRPTGRPPQGRAIAGRAVVRGGARQRGRFRTTAALRIRGPPGVGPPAAAVSTAGPSKHYANLAAQHPAGADRPAGTGQRRRGSRRGSDPGDSRAAPVAARFGAGAALALRHNNGAGSAGTTAVVQGAAPKTALRIGERAQRTIDHSPDGLDG